MMKSIFNFCSLTVIICGVLLMNCTNLENSNKEKKPTTQTKEILGNSFGIIPEPVSIKLTNQGQFSFEKGIDILINEELTSEIIYLQKTLSSEFQISSNLVLKSSNNNSIQIQITDELPAENHTINCNKTEILIEAGSPTSAFTAIQTIRQILSIKSAHSELPMISSFFIEDSPKFKWRGMLLDVCRHYFPKNTVMKYIDLLAFYKMNTLHWHITEDQAWRIAIDAYPKLTEIGAWREDPLAENGELYGGYYSKEDIREIVKYASERHIQIVPEIEMPGHSSAAVAAYPELGCNGEQISVPNDWGVFKDIYCPTEYTFEFLETVLGEVMELFPSNYVHIGGDEAPKTRWEESEFCKKLMKKEGLSDYEELQSFFINRMAEYLKENGKTIIGWDEILNDELTESAIIQSWRGMDGGKKAVSEGRQAIMSPTSHCYLDYSLKTIDTEKIYGFNPIPPDCSTQEAARILGAECNMWTEHVPDEKTLDSKVFPRLIAASESFWGTNDDYEGFLERLDAHYNYLDIRGVMFGSETVAVSVETNTNREGITVQITENLRNPETTYSFDSKGGFQDGDHFEGEIINVPQNSESKLLISSGVKSSANQEEISISFNHHSWLAAHVEYSVPFSDYYTAGGTDGLTDGVLGSLDFRDGHWQGFFGDDVELIIENPNENKKISSVSMNFYRYINSWIFPPESVSIAISQDGATYTELDTQLYAENEMHVRGKEIITSYFNFEPADAKYLKVIIKNIGKVPHWHEASSEPAWVFLDEVVVK